MPNVNIKNMPQELYENLKRRATENRRSINSEILMALEMGLRSRRIKVNRFLAHVEQLQQKIEIPLLTDVLLKKAKRQGRV